YLDQYRSLFRSLTAPAHLVFISSARRHVHAARVVFDHFVDEQAGECGRAGRDLAARLLPYFRVRALFESRQFDQLTQASMDLLRDGRDAFRGPRFDAWFEQWRLHGDGV